MSQQKKVPKSGKDKNTGKATETTRSGSDDRGLSDKERSGPSREHNG